VTEVGLASTAPAPVAGAVTAGWLAGWPDASSVLWCGLGEFPAVLFWPAKKPARAARLVKAAMSAAPAEIQAGPISRRPGRARLAGPFSAGGDSWLMTAFTPTAASDAGHTTVDRSAHLDDANLAGAKLTKANLWGSYLRSADLTGAKLIARNQDLEDEGPEVSAKAFIRVLWPPWLVTGKRVRAVKGIKQDVAIPLNR
jgi:Pentapeptide repeats (8 copies)